MKKIASIVMVLTLIVPLSLFGYSKPPKKNIYANSENWAYAETDITGKDVDVFFICPTVYRGSENSFNMSLDDVDIKARFLGATNMEKGIYDEECRFFAPYYRQVGLNVYDMDDEVSEQYLAIAYGDVEAAFTYYLEHYNKGRPIVLAGFSQGAQLCIRLMKNFFGDEETASLLVACYAIGWRLTEAEVTEYPHLKAAQRENDIGVIITFNSEAESITGSLMVPQGTKTLSINPLNWKTDKTVADKTLNLGACFTNYHGKIVTEVPQLTGAYIDSGRGTLKIIDVSPEQYPPVLSSFKNGIYHLYDYQFFYRNLQNNVSVRVNAYLNGVRLSE